MFPGMIQMVMNPIGAAVMSFPMVIAGINMRRFRMSWTVGLYPVLLRLPLLWPRRLLNSRSPGARALLLMRGRRTVGRNVPAPNFGLAAVLRLLPPLILRERSHAHQNCKSYNLFHLTPP